MSGTLTHKEDWRETKSRLIRSLFHDISILSTVEEESKDSSQDYHAPPQEVFPSPPRSYSPLPPLIIERVPLTNKHDETEEYYIKLYKKIKRVYRKLFIENWNLSSVDYDSISNDSSFNVDNLTITSSNGSGSLENLDLRFLESISPKNKTVECSIEDRGARQSSCSTESTGFGEESDNEDDISNGGLDNWRSIENKRSNTERIDDEASSKEQNSRHSTIHDEEITESGKSNETVEQSYEEEESNHETDKFGKLLIDDPELSSEDYHNSRNNDLEIASSQDSIESENEQQSENQTKSDTDSHDSEPKPNRGETTRASEGRSESVASNNEPMEGDVETNTSSEGAVYQQITTKALVHVDTSKYDGDRESRVFEDSVKSPILLTRFRRAVRRCVDNRIKVLAVVEEKEDPKPAPIIDTDEDESTEDFEDVRTSPADIRDEHSEEMRISPADDIEEDTGAMRTSMHETTEKNIEETRALRLDAFGKKIKAMRMHQSESFEKDTKETAIYRPDATEIEEMRTPLLDSQEDNEKISSSIPDTTNEPMEEIRTTHHDATNAEERTNRTEIQEEKDGEESYEEIDPIEQMRTAQRSLSHGTIPITHRSSSESNTEHTALPQEATAMTSSSQDGVEQDISEIQTSNEMNEILTSILNESRSKNQSRKRKLVDKSTQTVQRSTVTWEEMRANFFVGTPKIFRLCACKDHVCN